MAHLLDIPPVSDSAPNSLKFDIQRYIILNDRAGIGLSIGFTNGINDMKKMEVKQLELECEGEGIGDGSTSRSPDEELMQRVDKIISDTTRNVRPYLNRMVKDVERLLEGSFIRTPDSNVLDDMVGGLEKNIRKFVKEVIALKQWNKPSPPHSSRK